MLQKENDFLKSDLDQVKNQRALIETLRKELLAVRNDQTALSKMSQEQQKELMVKEELIQRIREAHESKLER